MKVLFLPRYGPLAGSSRYMTYDYLNYFEEAGICCDVYPLLDDHYLRNSRQVSGSRQKLYTVGPHVFKKCVGRLIKVLSAHKYRTVVLEKDVVPFMPSGLEQLLFARNRNVVVMYDEAVYDYYRLHRNKWLRRITQGKIEYLMRHSSQVIAWNSEVADYARGHNPNVTEVRLGIDLQRYKRRDNFEIRDRPIRIGWIGSPSGFQYLHNLDSVFSALSEKFNIELYIVSSEEYFCENVRVINRPWSVQTEVQDLLAMDIGIMPLPNNEWTLGKSGCKMLQYMGVGLPVVVSPVGINAEAIQGGRSGLSAKTDEEWYAQLARLIEDVDLRGQLGYAARNYIEENNSQAQMAQQLTSVLQNIA